MKTCIRVVPAQVVSVSGTVATVKLLTSTDNTKNFTADIICRDTVSANDYVNVAYWDNLTTAVVFSK